ncbi:MAG: glycosyltransferase family 2 protein [Psychromonas sp.]
MLSAHNQVVDVSIIIAAWNSETFINKAIDSALAQVGVTVEIIVVDDCSTDNTCAVVSAYLDLRVKLIRSQINSGPGGARNLGLANAKGKWIAILDSDDYFLPTRLQEMLLHDDGKTEILIDDLLEQQENCDKLTPFFHNGELPVGELTLSYLMVTNLIFTELKSTGYVKPLFLNAFIKQKQIQYWPDVRIGEDYYFLASCLSHGAKAKVLALSLYVYTIRSASISGKLTVEHVDKLISADQKFKQVCKLNIQESEALEFRNQNILRAKNFIILVNKIKNKELFFALGHALSHPNAIGLLWLPIRKRIIGR